MSEAATGAALVRSLVGAVAPAVLLFAAAGTLAWPAAWIFLALLNGCSAAMGLWLRRRDPGLLAARMASPLAAGQTGRDRGIMAAIAVAFAAWFLAMGLDRRFGASGTPWWLAALGVVLILLAFWGWVAVLRANSFAAVTIRVQHERGQRVVATGPYGVIRHPMYADALLLIAGTPLLLGTLWGLAGLVVLAPLVAARALGEEALLLAELPGYRDYAARVRFRLLPGIW